MVLLSTPHVAQDVPMDVGDTEPAKAGGVRTTTLILGDTPTDAPPDFIVPIVPHDWNGMTQVDKLLLTLVNKAREVRVSYPSDLARGTLGAFMRENLWLSIFDGNRKLITSPLVGLYRGTLCQNNHCLFTNRLYICWSFVSVCRTQILLEWTGRMDTA